MVYSFGNGLFALQSAALLSSTARNCVAGLEAAGNTVGTPARFTVETYSAGRGQLEVVVLNAHGIRESVRQCFLLLLVFCCMFSVHMGV